MLFKIPAKSLGSHTSRRCHLFQCNIAAVMFHDIIIDGADAYSFMIADGLWLHIICKRIDIFQRT